ncbi:MAG: Gfo/Idh/MocA family oxidoreductase, partial [Proteobacteria bacterium]
IKELVEREILKSKDFGDIKFVDASNCQSSANPDHWRHKMALAGGGALPDIGLYCLNTTRFVLGMEPTEVFAYQHSTPGNPLFTEVEEMMSWQMKFPNGIVANCSTHYNVHESRYYRVLSERGWTHLDNAYAYKGQKLTVAQAKDKIRSIEEMTIAETDQFEVEMDYFSDCVMHDRRPFSTGEEGLHDHIIMEAIYESANSGRPVKIKSDVDLKNMRGPEALI